MVVLDLHLQPHGFFVDREMMLVSPAARDGLSNTAPWRHHGVPVCWVEGFRVATAANSIPLVGLVGRE